MRLHVKACPYCKRCAVKVDGEQQWHRSMVDVTVERLEELHEVVSKASDVCEACNTRIVSGIAETAGSVH